VTNVFEITHGRKFFGQLASAETIFYNMYVNMKKYGLGKIFGDFFTNVPTTRSYNARVVKTYNAASSLKIK
jgi:hypothetical protein